MVAAEDRIGKELPDGQKTGDTPVPPEFPLTVTRSCSPPAGNMPRYWGVVYTPVGLNAYGDILKKEPWSELLLLNSAPVPFCGPLVGSRTHKYS